MRNIIILILLNILVSCTIKKGRPQNSTMLFLKFNCEENKQEIFSVSVRIPYKQETETRITYAFDEPDLEFYAPKAQFSTINTSSVYYQRAIDIQDLKKTLSKIKYNEVATYIDDFSHIFIIDLEESRNSSEYKIVEVQPYYFLAHMDIEYYTE